MKIERRIYKVFYPHILCEMSCTCARDSGVLSLPGLTPGNQGVGVYIGKQFALPILIATGVEAREKVLVGKKKS